MAIFSYCLRIDTRLGMLVVLPVLCMLIWPWPDPRSKSRSLTFSISTNCTFLRLSPLPFWYAAQNWWLITTVWDLVYSYSDPDLWISPPVGGHVTSKFVKCWYHQNPLDFISELPAAISLWLWLQIGRNKPWTLAAMTVSTLAGLFLFKIQLKIYLPLLLLDRRLQNNSQHKSYQKYKNYKILHKHAISNRTTLSVI